MHKAVSLVLLTALLSSSCATGYGTLAAAGAGVILGTIGTAVSAASDEEVDGTLIAQGAATGALFGVVGAAVAAAVAHHEGRKQERARSTKAREERTNAERIRALEEALKVRQLPQPQQRDPQQPQQPQPVDQQQPQQFQPGDQQQPQQSQPVDQQQQQPAQYMPLY